MCSGTLFVASEVGGDDLSIIEDKHVAVAKVLEQVIKLLVLYLTGVAVEHHHPTTIAKRIGFLCDEIFWQSELEL